MLSTGRRSAPCKETGSAGTAREETTGASVEFLDLLTWNRPVLQALAASAPRPS